MSHAITLHHRPTRRPKKSLFASLKKKWRSLADRPAGERFKQIYASARRRRRSTPLWERAMRLMLAAVAFVLGVIFAVLPGPAFVFFIIAGALLATESHAVAVLLDWGELRLRALWGWAKRRWRKMNPAGRIIVATTGTVGMLGAAAFMGWMVLAG